MFSTRNPENSLLDLNDLVQETLSMLRIELKTHGISVAIEPEDLPAIVRGRKGQLLQLVMNIISNAIDAMADVTGRTRPLRIESKVHGSRVSLLIEDSGPGIDSTRAQRIFEPFFTTKAKGMGLGLAICKSIIESHEGSLSVRSARQFGSTFCIDLPIAKAVSPSAFDAHQAFADWPQHPKHRFLDARPQRSDVSSGLEHTATCQL
jgi:signal transduction histidine kinase